MLKFLIKKEPSPAIGEKTVDEQPAVVTPATSSIKKSIDADLNKSVAKNTPSVSSSTFIADISTPTNAKGSTTNVVSKAPSITTPLASKVATDAAITLIDITNSPKKPKVSTPVAMVTTPAPSSVVPAQVTVTKVPASANSNKVLSLSIETDGLESTTNSARNSIGSSAPSSKQLPLPPSTCTTVVESSFPTPISIPSGRPPTPAEVKALFMMTACLEVPAHIASTYTASKTTTYALPPPIRTSLSPQPQPILPTPATVIMSDKDTPSPAPTVYSFTQREKITSASPAKKFTSENYKYRDDPANYDEEGELKIKHMSCDTVRAKINTFLASKEMTQTKFLETIKANSNSYGRFMSYRGRDRGSDNSVYYGALIFFAERDKKEKLKKQEENEALKAAAKKGASSSQSSTPNIVAGTPSSLTGTPSSSMLPMSSGSMTATPSGAKKRTADEMISSFALGATPQVDGTPSSISNSSPCVPTSAGPSIEPKAKKSTSKAAEAEALLKSIAEVPLENHRVFDDCDDIRAKIATFVHNTGTVSMAKFADAVDATPRSVNLFMAKKGYNEGAGSKIYINSYIFFEKLRLMKNEPKSNKRIKNEQKNPNGFDLIDPPRYVWTFKG